MKDFLAHVYDALPLVVMALAGALAQCLQHDWQGWKNFLASLTTAGFGALLVGLAAQDLNLSEGLCYILSGMIGYSGGTLVDNFLAMTREHLDHHDKR